MNLDSLTLGQVKELRGFFGAAENKADDSHWEIGKPYLIRTVTMIDTGRLVKVTPTELVLEDAAWVADTGRFADALKNLSVIKEVEPFPDGKVILNRSAIIDAVQIPAVLREQK